MRGGKRGQMKKIYFNIITQTGRLAKNIAARAFRREKGIDGILVTVGLCIIALLLCVVMKDSLTAFIETLVEAMTLRAQQILSGVTS